jgi:molybdopterin molybdotransferase
MISAQEALQIILERAQPLETVSVALQHSLGYATAENVRSEMNIPPFDNAGMDGYAVRAEDIVVPPKTLALLGEVSAGTPSVKPLGANEAYLITTGAKIPPGCTAVAQNEIAEPVDANHVKILQSVSQGAHIRKAGGDIRKGDLVLGNGRQIRPQEIGVLASLGKQFVNVYRKPSVAVVATGSELVELNKPLTDGKIRNSNARMLLALLEDCSATGVNLGIAKDVKDEISGKLREGLHADMLITSGGVSAGKYDLVIDAMKEVGIEIVFWKVNIKPGMPMAFGMYGAKPVFGLPGNSVSTMVTFLKFVKPAIQKLSGFREMEHHLKLRAVLTHEVKKTDGRRHFVRGVFENIDGKLQVTATGSQVSNVLTSLSKANCLIVLPEETGIAREGEEVEIELL